MPSNTPPVGDGEPLTSLCRNSDLTPVRRGAGTVPGVGRHEGDWVQIETADGQVLDGDLMLADDSRATAVLCHPHPQYGGSRFDRVIEALFRELPTHGIDTLRFDFRRAYGGGVAERLDAIAAIDLLAGHRPGSPIHLIGYSFGAMVALGVTDPRVASHVLIAPPLVGDNATVEPPPGPMLMVIAEHDQFCGPDAATDATSSWQVSTTGVVDLRLETIEMADHFFGGRVDAVVTTVTAWLRER